MRVTSKLLISLGLCLYLAAGLALQTWRAVMVIAGDVKSAWEKDPSGLERARAKARGNGKPLLILTR